MIQIAIMTCEARRGMAERLADRIDGAVSIVYDDGRGCWHTARRAWEGLATLEGTHGLVLQEDVAVCQDFREAAERAVAAKPARPVGFYSNRKGTDAVRERGGSWHVIKDGAWGQAICLPLHWVDDMLEWLGRPGAYSPRWKKRIADFPERSWYDRRVVAYLDTIRSPVYCTVPSLVEHVGASDSLLGHNNRNRVARWFIGENVSGLTIDWDHA